MNLYIKLLLGILLLNKGPQDLPHSKVLMKLCLLVYFVTGLPNLLLGVGLEVAFLALALDILVLLIFVYLVLQAFTKLERFVQTITALSCIGVVFNLATLPLLSHLMVNTGEEKAAFTFLFLLGLYSWFLAVYTHIFREAFGIRLPAAMLLTISYVLINLMVELILLPQLG